MRYRTVIIQYAGSTHTWEHILRADKKRFEFENEYKQFLSAFWGLIQLGIVKIIKDYLSDSRGNKLNIDDWNSLYYPQ